MVQTRDDFEKSIKEEKEKLSSPDKKEAIARINIALQASVDQGVLTSSEAWNKFLSYLQAAKERVDEQIANHSTHLMRPDVAKDEDVRAIKLIGAYNIGQQQALEWVMSMPKAIMDTGKMAGELKVEVQADDSEGYARLI